MGLHFTEDGLSEFIVDLREPFLDLKDPRLAVFCQPETILFWPKAAGSVDLTERTLH